MRMGRLHRERIGVAGLRRELVVVPSDASAEDADRAVSRMKDPAVVFIHGAEQNKFDGVKSRFVELGHMGVCPDSPGAHLWWGSVRGWESAGESAGGSAGGSAGNLPVIVSYFTTNTPYEDEARELAATCDALGLEHRIVGVPARGTWEGNCAMKAGFVLEMWRSLGRPVLWVDADARVRRAPELLRGMSADFGVYKAARWQFASGTVFVNATELGGELLRVWKRRCEEQPRVWDQVHLDHAWEEVSMRAPLETAWLPQAYTRIFDKPEEHDGGGAAVIEHFQASRRLKKMVTAGEPRAFVDFDEATKAARRASRPRAA